jgi:hypothetical protein
MSSTSPKAINEKRFDRFEWLALFGLVIVLLGFNYSVYQKEDTLQNGVDDGRLHGAEYRSCQ